MTDPAAMTPAERKRHWMINLMVGFGVFAALGVIVMTCIILLGRWAPEFEGRRLNIMAGVLVFYALINMVVILALSLGGPVGRWTMKFGNKELSAAGDGEPIEPARAPPDHRYGEGRADEPAR